MSKQQQTLPTKPAEPEPAKPKTEAEALLALTDAGRRLAAAHRLHLVVAEQLRWELEQLAPALQDGLLPAWRVKRYLTSIAVANSGGTLKRAEANKIADKVVKA